MAHTISVVITIIYFAISSLNIISCIWLAKQLDGFLNRAGEKTIKLSANNLEINGLSEMIEEIWAEKKMAHDIERLSLPEPARSSD